MNKTVWLPLILCLIVALALPLVRGDVPGERAYAAFQSARDLRGLGDLGGLHSPLFVALLAGAGRLGLPIPQTGILLSMAGWPVAIVAVYSIGLRFKRPVLAIFAAGALTLEPTFPRLLGQDTLFVMGWLWGALANLKSEVRGRKSEVGGRKPEIQNLQFAICNPLKREILQSAIPNWLAGLALVVLAVSIVYHASFAPRAALWESYTPTLLPGLALLAGLVLDKLIEITGRLAIARADRQVLAVDITVIALLALGWLRQPPKEGDSEIQNPKSEIERRALWEQAGLWLRDNTPPEATVWSDEDGTLSYFSERRIVRTAAPDAPPDYGVTLNSLAWTERLSLPWFQEHYRRVHVIANPYDSIAPLTIWRYRPGPFDVGPTSDVHANFGGKMELMSYRLDSAQLIPGEKQHLTLTWRALKPLMRPFGVRVRIYDPATRRVRAQVDHPTPAGLQALLWPVNRPLADRYTLDIPNDLPPGVYWLDTQVYADNVGHFLAVQSRESRDQLTLAQLEAQPWVSQEPLRAAHPLTATFGDKIELTGYGLNTVGGAPVIIERGRTLRVRLYWHALAAPDASYHVFTHLLTSDNRLVSQHDSVPAYETYPTNTWQAGQYILDEHPIPIDPATPPGRYWLKVGLYVLDSGERLAVRGPAGQEPPDRSLPLIQVDVE